MSDKTRKILGNISSIEHNQELNDKMEIVSALFLGLNPLFTTDEPNATVFSFCPMDY